MEIKNLLSNIPQTGRVQWIGIRPGKRLELESLSKVSVSKEEGLSGDHYRGRSKNRQVTCIQKEHLNAVGQMLQREVTPDLCRRNLVIEGINLLALQDNNFQIGDEVILKVTGLCHPCTRMEENLGTGGYQAMRGHGGITAQVIQGGIIKVGDSVKMLKAENNERI